MPPPELTLRARYVFPVDAPPIESGVLRVAGERIVSVDSTSSKVDLDLGNAAIVPGFVNAHTHLELSTLRARQLGGADFVTWLRRVIEARVKQTPAEVAHAVARGIDASLAAGTTLIGDISTSGRSWKELARSPLRAVVFAELLGLKPERAIQTVQAARQFLEWASPPDTISQDLAGTIEQPQQVVEGFCFRDGTRVEPLPCAWPARGPRRLSPSLSPHAPYSTHVLLYDLAAYWAQKAQATICTHLAETNEELRLLLNRDGPLRDFLISLGAWSDDLGLEPIRYVEGHGSNQANWLLAHGNYLTDQEILQLGAHSENAALRRAIAFCPRTHNYFGHRQHPYAKMMAARVTVCLGTDSLASSPNLSVLDEMRFLHRRDPTLSGAELLHMGTLAGAWALGREHETGSLTPGKFADLAVIRLASTDANDPHELLLNSAEPVVRTMIGGRLVFQLR